jgi:hypothetical protein
MQLGDEWLASLLGRFNFWEKASQYPVFRRLGGPQSRFGRYGEVKILDHSGTQTPIPLSSSQ